MRIKSVQIKNLRVFEDQTVVFGPYTCLVGANGAGKSTVLCALNIFFRETDNSSTNLGQLDIEDFHLRNTKIPIEITVTFCDLSPDAQEDFKHYYRQEVLIVTAKAEFDENLGHALVRQYASRLAMKQFAPYFEGVKSKVGAQRLKEIFAGLRADFEGIESATTMDDMANSLRRFEGLHPELCVPLPSEDQFYGASNAAGRLEKYIQWIYVPAVKNAADEQTEKSTALGRLLQRTVRAKINFSERIKALRDEALARYTELIDAEQGALSEISSALQNRLADWSHPDATARLAWHQDPKTSVRVEEPIAHLFTGDGEFEGQIARFGHGMQRSYIIALLQVLATMDDAETSTLVFACEEPELYQHPPQARHLASLLQGLAEGNAQILLSTHSPIFVDGVGFESIRLVRKLRNDRLSTIRQPLLANISVKVAAATSSPLLTPTGLMAKLHQVLLPTLNEMFFATSLVLVEGLEDAAYINAWLVVSGRWDAFRRCGGHVVAVNKKSEMIQPLAVAQELSIPTFAVFDADADKLNHINPEIAATRRIQHERDNRALLFLCGGETAEPFPTATIWERNFVTWPHDFAASIRTDVGEDVWTRTSSQADAEFGSPGGTKKNTLKLGAQLRLIHEEGMRPPSLERLCDQLIAFGTT